MTSFSQTTAGWLNALPSGWHIVPAKVAFVERRETNRSDDVHLTPSQVYGVRPQSEYMALTGNAVVQNIAGQDTMKHVESDDFIIHLRSFQGGIERSRVAGKVSAAYTVLIPQGGVVPDFFQWLLKSEAYVQELRTTTNQLRDGQSIKYRDFAKVAIPIPPVAAQRVIADYLDRETARIDALVEEQRCLIDLLHERRLASVVEVFSITESDRAGHPGSHSSAIPWLPSFTGKRARLRNVCVISTGSSDSVNASESGYPFFVRGDQPLRLGTFEFDGEAVITAGDGAMVGRSFHHYVGKFAAHQRVYVLHGFRGVHGRYLYWYFSTFFIRVVGDGGAQATVPSVRRPMIADMPIPLPAVDEQRRVAAYLDDRTAKIDELIAEAERFIELSRERRAALITAAVTGQIDVRREVA